MDIITENIKKNNFFCVKLSASIPYVTCALRHTQLNVDSNKTPKYPFCYTCKTGEQITNMRKEDRTGDCACCGRAKQSMTNMAEGKAICSGCYVQWAKARRKDFTFEQVKEFMSDCIKKYGEDLRNKGIKYPWNDYSLIGKARVKENVRKSLERHEEIKIKIKPLPAKEPLTSEKVSLEVDKEINDWILDNFGEHLHYKSPSNYLNSILKKMKDLEKYNPIVSMWLLS